MSRIRRAVGELGRRAFCGLALGELFGAAVFNGICFAIFGWWRVVHWIVGIYFALLFLSWLAVRFGRE